MSEEEKDLEEEINEINDHIRNLYMEMRTAFQQIKEIKPLAPCLIDGHEADESADITVREHAPGGTYYKRLPIASRNDGQGNIEAVYFKLCARCGVVYEEKTK